jgi:hypothetical protein
VLPCSLAAVQTEVVCSSKTFVTTDKTKGNHNPEDHNQQLPYKMSTQSYVMFVDILRDIISTTLHQSILLSPTFILADNTAVLKLEIKRK